MTTVYLVKDCSDYECDETLFCTLSRERAELLAEKEREQGGTNIVVEELTPDSNVEERVERLYREGFLHWVVSMSRDGEIITLRTQAPGLNGIGAIHDDHPLPKFSQMIEGRFVSMNMTPRLVCTCWAKDKMEAAEILDRERIRRINEGEWKE